MKRPDRCFGDMNLQAPLSPHSNVPLYSMDCLGEAINFDIRSSCSGSLMIGLSIALENFKTLKLQTVSIVSTSKDDVVRLYMFTLLDS